jgi:ABC-2 type transport system ATP-binding protein
VMASGRVAAEGTMAAVVGGTRSVEVRAGRWEAAFTALDAAGLPVSLVGRALRVPGADRAAVAGRLAEAGVDADLEVVPASFEEAFVVLAGRAA